MKSTNLPSVKKIMLWGREDLFCQAVEFFLSSQKEWEVVRISNDEGIEGLFAAVEQIEPNVIVIHQGDCNNDTLLPMELFRERPDLKIVSVSLENNAMEVYDKREVWIKQVSDLLSVIQN